MGALKRHAQDTAAPAADNQNSGQYLTFELAGETFAIGILSIKEIIEFDTLTLVPLMPPFIRGVMNLRGTVVPVIDLALRFGRTTTVPGRRTCVVILECESDEHPQFIGVLVDAVHEVLTIPDGDIEPPPQFGNRIRTDFIAGMARLERHFIVVLDVTRVLSIEEMALLAELTQDDAPAESEG